MKKLIRLLFFYGSILLLIILGIVIIKTISYSSKQIQVPATEKISLGDEVVNRLTKAIQIPSISFEDHIDSSAFRALKSFMDNSFPLVDSLLEKTVISEYSLLYYWPGRKPALPPALLMAHLDVVPIEEATKDKWEQEPFSGIVKDDFIWGRGTLDDKGSALAILEAIEILLSQNYHPERSLYISFGHDEEVSGKNGAQKIVEHLQKNNIQLEYVLDEGMVIMDGALPGLDQPLALVGIAEKGFVTLQLTVQLEEGGHSSMPPPETAIGILSKAILDLRTNPFPADLEGPVQQLFDRVGPEMSMPLKAVFANLWLFEGILKGQLSKANSSNAIMRTTTAPTIFNSGMKDNVLPSRAEAKINFRIRPGETVQSVKDYVVEIINDDRVQVGIKNPAFAVDPSPVSSTSAFGYEVIEKSIKEIFPNVIVAPSVVIAATDSRHFTKVANQVYRFFPVKLVNEDLSRIHGINERIGVEAYKDAIRFYHRLIMNSCK